MERYVDCLAVAFLAAATLTAAAASRIDFDQHVRSIVASRCFSCDGAVAQAGLSLDHRQTAPRGGDYGPLIVPVDSANSKLIKRLVGTDSGLQMPPTEPLDAKEIGILRAWIDHGAVSGETRHIEPASKPVRPALTRFFTAIRAQDQTAVKAQIAADPYLVWDGDSTGTNAPYYAGGFGFVAIYKTLLAAGVKPTADNRLRLTPLHWAVADAEKLKLLLDARADDNARTLDGRTPLYLTAGQSNRECVAELLLSRGADPNTKLMTGRTPLMAAAPAPTWRSCACCWRGRRTRWPSPAVVWRARET